MIRLKNYFNAELQSKNWKIKFTIYLFVLAMICSTPYFNYLFQPDYFQHPYWVTVMKQVHSSTIYKTYEGVNPVSHEAKKTFRLTVPIIARIFHLNEIGIYLLQFLLGILFIYFIIDYAWKSTNDRLLAFYIALGATSVYFGTACFTDLYSYFSGWAFLFLFLCIYSKNNWLIFLLATLAAWTDERAFLSLVYPVFYWQIKNYFTENKSLKDLLIPQKKSIVIIVAMLVYVLARIYLQYAGFGTSHVESFLLSNLEIAPIGVFTFFEGFWILIAYKFYVLLSEKKYALFFISLLLLMAMSVGSLIVLDITRSGSFMLLEVFISVYIILQLRGAAVLKSYLFFAVLICVIFPPYNVIGLNGPVLLQRNVIYLACKFLVGHVHL
ncbi:MAG: hypothetical protein RJA07_56 [Bacteroidota bacterium]|jgi:hypothetical protein